MQFRPDLVQAILDRDKTQTRRPFELGDNSSNGTAPGKTYWVKRNRRLKWMVGSIYAVQPGRGKPAVARIKVLRIRREDVRDISLQDAIAEGFEYRDEFWRVWTGFYDPDACSSLQGIYAKLPVFKLRLFLQSRPNHLYHAWALDFELVEGSVLLPLSVYGEGVGGRGT